MMCELRTINRQYVIYVYDYSYHPALKQRKKNTAFIRDIPHSVQLEKDISGLHIRGCYDTARKQSAFVFVRVFDIFYEIGRIKNIILACFLVKRNKREPFRYNLIHFKRKSSYNSLDTGQKIHLGKVSDIDIYCLHLLFSPEQPVDKAFYCHLPLKRNPCDNLRFGDSDSSF